MKTENESFCYNKWMKCVAITFCVIYMVIFFFLIFYEDTLDYQLLKFDQHCSKGSKHSPVCVSKDCPKECVCMCIYIIYFKI